MTERIWAPWRRAYIMGQKRSSGCLFCRLRRAAPRSDPKNLLLIRASHSFVVLNRYPYTNGHVMVVPNRHVPSIGKLRDEEKLDLLRLVDRSVRGLTQAFHPQGFNIGINLGRAGGAGVPGHVHLHVVPRWIGDTNFMPSVAGVRVISDSLKEAYRELRHFLAK